jgi:hypothetical protein
LRGSPASFTGDEFIPAGWAGSDDDRLQDAALADRLSQCGERGFLEVLAGLVGVGVDLVEREVPQPALSRQTVRGWCATLGLRVVVLGAGREGIIDRQPALA